MRAAEPITIFKKENKCGKERGREEGRGGGKGRREREEGKGGGKEINYKRYAGLASRDSTTLKRTVTNINKETRISE